MTGSNTGHAAPRRGSARRALKPRLDELLVQRGLFADLHSAQAAVMAGNVVVGEHRETSAGKRLPYDVALRVKGGSEFASRGGYKLQGALDSFGLSVRGKRCIDLGASTGGFTDCLLKAGASFVVAIDVGEPLMRWELQHDARVDYRPSTDVRGLDPSSLGGAFQVAVADLSFISLTGVLADVAALLEDGGMFVSLIKPQFEVRRAEVGEGGIVRDPRLHARAIASVLEASDSSGLLAQGLSHSPIKGTKGNIEFLYWARKDLAANSPAPAQNATIAPEEIERVVQQAHAQLGGTR